MAGRVTSASFVGRQDELGRLHQALQSVVAGEPGTWLIAGEAGVGKTRLVEEFAVQVDDRAQVLLGRCLQLSGGGLPYGPIADALRELTRGLDPDEIDGLLGPPPTDLTRLLPGATPTRSTEPVGEFAQARLFESTLRFLDRLAQEQPVVLIIEDVHWADRSTLDLLRFLVRMVRHERLLVVATLRSDELHPQHALQMMLAELDRSRRLEVLELAPFDREDLGLLLGGILGRLPSPATVQRIFARSGGNAFLAEELLAAETDQPGQELPRRLQGILLARVAALAEDTRHVLRLTATVGRPIEHHLLAAAAQLPEPRLLAATREAVDRQVLRAERDRYGFRHMLLQQAGNFDHIQRAYLNLSYVLGVDAGRPHEGLQVLEQGLARLREFGLELALPGNTLRANLAGALWSVGRWQELEDILNQTLTSEVPARFAVQLPLLRARLHLARGQFDLAREQAQVAARMAEQLTDPAPQSSLQKFLAELAIWQGDAAAARSAAAKALQYLTEDDRSYAIAVCRIGLRAEADAAERAHDRRADPSEVAAIHATGERLLDHARESLARLGTKLHGARADAAGCEAEFARLELRSDPARWAAQAATWEALSEPYEAAYARWRQAEALLVAKEPGAAAILRRAYEITVELGAISLRHELGRLAQRARIDLRPPNARPADNRAGRIAKAPGLTPREQEVLRHLVEGRTNRQIARTLFISEKTASVHVSNIMGKLGAANRSEAAAIAHRLRLVS